MKNIMLVCGAGMSTSLLVTKMQEAAKEAGVEAEIWAIPEADIAKHVGEFDVCLLGPQVRFKKKAFDEKYADKGIEFMVIDTVDYGMMNGEKVFKTVLEHLEKK